MKSEEFILQELEKEKQQKAAEEGQQGEQDKPILKFMISGEAPVLMSKACELLIKDLSFRAWRHTERNRRRTLQRQDLHAAVGESEVYDFLIDIVPRVSTPKTSGPNPTDAAAAAAAAMAPPMPTGIPMGSIPTGLPAVPAPMGAAVGQPMQVVIDGSVIQHHHQPPAQQQPGQNGLVQYTDQSQQQPQYQYVTVPQVNPSDPNQATTQIPVGVAVPQQGQVWMTQAVANTGSAPQPS